MRKQTDLGGIVLFAVMLIFLIVFVYGTFGG